MTTRTFAFTPWGDTTKGRFGFSIGRHGMFSWPLPLPDELHFGSSPSGFDGDPIDSWLDVSGSLSLDSSGSERPTVDAINGVPAALFDGSDDVLDRTTSLPSANIGEIWTVIDFTTTATDQNIWLLHGDQGPDTNLPYLALSLISGKLYVFFAPNGSPAVGIYGSTSLAAGAYVIRVLSTGSAWKIFINGVEDTPYGIYAGSNSGEWCADVSPRVRFRIGKNYFGTGQVTGSYGFLMLITGLLSDLGADSYSRLLMGAYGIS